jgi:transcriptional regulator with XRE-family HTH domain
MTRLQEIRRLKGMTQRELADASGVSLRMVQHYERGEFRFENVGVLVLLKFSNVLDVPLSSLLDGEAQAEAVLYDRRRKSGH